jgi:hypothetical protein
MLPFKSILTKHSRLTPAACVVLLRYASCSTPAACLVLQDSAPPSTLLWLKICAHNS